MWWRTRQPSLKGFVCLIESTSLPGFQFSPFSCQTLALVQLADILPTCIYAQQRVHKARKAPQKSKLLNSSWNFSYHEKCFHWLIFFFIFSTKLAECRSTTESASNTLGLFMMLVLGLSLLLSVNIRVGNTKKIKIMRREQKRTRTERDSRLLKPALTMIQGDQVDDPSSRLQAPITPLIQRLWH